MSMHTPLIDRNVTLQLRPRLPTMDARALERGSPIQHGTPMHPSFAQIRGLLMGTVLACALSACATLPPPTGELATAQQALTRAEGADADQYASEDLAVARTALARAQAALASGRENDARNLALAAAADADLAYAKSREALASTELAQRKSEIADLQRRLQMEDGQ